MKIQGRKVKNRNPENQDWKIKDLDNNGLLMNGWLGKDVAYCRKIGRM